MRKPTRCSSCRQRRQVAGTAKTRPDHKVVSDQLYTLYARAVEVRRMAAVVGEENLSDEERGILGFADRFEKLFLNQGGRPRTFRQSIEIAWSLLAELDPRLLTRIPRTIFEEYGPGSAR